MFDSKHELTELAAITYMRQLRLRRERMRRMKKNNRKY